MIAYDSSSKWLSIHGQLIAGYSKHFLLKYFIIYAVICAPVIILNNSVSLRGKLIVVTGVLLTHFLLSYFLKVLSLFKSELFNRDAFQARPKAERLKYFIQGRMD